MQLGSGKKELSDELLDTGVDLDQALLTEEDSGRVERMSDSKELAGLTERFENTDAPADEKLVDVITHNAVYTVPHGLYVGKGNLKIGFGRNPGSLESLEIAGYNFLKGPLAPSFYRCPSNIDRTDRSFVLARTVFSKESDYEHIQESIKFVGSEYADCPET